MAGRGRQYASRVQIQQINDEVIWMLGYEVVGLEHLCRKILEVECHDQAGPGVDGGCRDVTVVRIRKTDRRIDGIRYSNPVTRLSRTWAFIS